MVKTFEPTIKVKAIIQVYDVNETENECMAYLDGEEYRGIVVQAKTISEALRELAISIDAINKYRMNQK